MIIIRRLSHETSRDTLDLLNAILELHEGRGETALDRSGRIGGRRGSPVTPVPSTGEHSTMVRVLSR